MTEGAPPNPDAHEIEALCAAAAGGDVEALERLLWLHHERLLSFARRKVGVDWQGKIDPEDVLQEAYIEVFRAISGFSHRGEDSFYHWAARIIDHRFVDQVRGLRRKKRDVGREIARGPGSSRGRDSLLERCMPETTTPSRIMRKQDAVGALMGCIAQLPDEYRLIVERVYLNEEPVADVAADIGKTEDAVRGIAARAVQRLKRGLGRASHYLSRPA